MALSESEKGAVIKGVTVYRDGSREKQVKSTSKDMQDNAEDADPIEMYQSGDWSDEDVREFMDKMVDVVGGDASLCPECDEGVMQAQEGCELCPVCQGVIEGLPWYLFRYFTAESAVRVCVRMYQRVIFIYQYSNDSTAMVLRSYYQLEAWVEDLPRLKFAIAVGIASFIGVSAASLLFQGVDTFHAVILGVTMVIVYAAFDPR